MHTNERSPTSLLLQLSRRRLKLVRPELVVVVVVVVDVAAGQVSPASATRKKRKHAEKKKKKKEKKKRSSVLILGLAARGMQKCRPTGAGWSHLKTPSSR